MALATMDERLAHLSFPRIWPVAMAVGVVTILAGLVAIAWPGATVLTLAIIFGLQLVVFGVYRTIAAFTRTGEGHRVWHLMVGLIAIGIGVLCLRNLFGTAVLLALAVGLNWILVGVLDAAGALFDRATPNRVLRVLMGGLSLLAGLIVVSTPGISLLALAWVLGIWLVVEGGIEIAMAMELRRLDKRLGTPRATTTPTQTAASPI